MPDHVLEWRVWLPRPRVEVFAFFADPAAPERLAPPWLAVRLLSPAASLAAGAVLDYRLRWLGIPLRWRSYVREYDPPARFVDVQVQGPCDRWEHRHLFVEEGGGTWVEDRVTYRLPLGPLGALVERLVVRRQLAAAWEHRRHRIAALLAPPLPGPP